MKRNIEKIIQKLNKAKARYEIIDNGISSVSLDEIVRHLRLSYGECIATLLMRNEKGEVVAILRRDDRKLDQKKFLALTKSKELRMCNLKELGELGFEGGLVSPLLLATSVTIYVDENIKKKYKQNNY